MHKLQFFLICFCLGGLLNGPGITDEFLEDMFRSENEDWYCLQLVSYLNRDLLRVGNSDTIAYRQEEDGIVFSYRESRLVGLCDFENTAVQVSIIDTGFRYIGQNWQAIFREPNGIERRVTTHSSGSNHLESSIVFAHYSDDMLTGHYTEITFDKVAKTEGAYQQIDSSYIDTIPTINAYLASGGSDDYIYVPRKRYPKKIGTWVYRNRSGDTLKMEHYPEKYD